jgi:hypothetical protein
MNRLRTTLVIFCALALTGAQSHGALDVAQAGAKINTEHFGPFAGDPTEKPNLSASAGARTSQDSVRTV